MCYTIFLSTTSPEALDALPSHLYQFSRPTEAEVKAIGGLLKHPYHWYLTGPYGGCSCHFRHLGEGSHMYFSAPEDWDPEDAEEIESTMAVYDALAHILASGNALDLIDLWNGMGPEGVKDLPVSLRDVTRERFRFFENYRFVLSL